MNYEQIETKVKQFRYHQSLHEYEKAEKIRVELRDKGITLTNNLSGTGWRKI